MSEKRKDNKGRILRTGESQRKDLIYQYRYTDIRGKRQTVYSSDLKELREKEKEIQKLNAELTKLKSADMFSNSVDIDGLELYTAKLDGTTPDSLRSMGDDMKNKGDNVVAVIAGTNGEKATIVAVCGKEAIAKGVKAGDLVREIAKLAGGGGGGRPDSAMAGAKDIAKLDSAIAQAEEIVKSLIK